MNLLVGATGFIGGHLVEYLFQQGEISKGAFRMGSHLKLMDLSGVQGIEVDLLDHHTLHEAAEGTDIIYSLASPTPGDGEDPMEVNTRGIMNLLEVAQEMKVKAIVHLSTLDVYGFEQRTIDARTEPRPTDAYQRAKAEGDKILLDFSRRSPSPRIEIVRAAKAVGSRDPAFVIPLLEMLREGRVVLPSGSPMSLSHPRDIAQALYKAATVPTPTGKVYLVKSFDSTPEALADGLAAAVGSSARAGKEGFLRRSRLPPYTTSQLKASLRVEAQEEWKEIGYSPEFDLQKTVEEIAGWYRREPWLAES